MFGGVTGKEDPFIAILEPVKGRTFTIGAGAIQGLQEGTFLAIYAPDAKKLIGEDLKLGNARVVRVEDFTSVAEFPSIPARPIPDSAKVAIVTPNFGSQRLRVNMAANVTGTTLSDKDEEFLSEVSKSLRDTPLVQIVQTSPTTDNKADTAWDLGVQIGCINNGQVVQITGKQIAPKKDDCGQFSAAVYLVTPDRNEPIYGFWRRMNDPTATENVFETILKRAKQENIRAVSNARSPLNGLVKLTIIKVDVATGANGKRHITSETELPESSVITFPIGQRYRLKIVNNSDTDLDVVLLELGSSGSVTLLTPRGVGLVVPKRGGSMTTHEVWKIDLPAGIETFKAIAYTTPDDSPPPNFALLEQSGVVGRKAVDTASPLSWLVGQTVAGSAKDGNLDGQLTLSSWTVVRTDISVQFQ